MLSAHILLGKQPSIKQETLSILFTSEEIKDSLNASQNAYEIHKQLFPFLNNILPCSYFSAKSMKVKYPYWCYRI